MRSDVAFVLAALRHDAGARRARHEAAAGVDDWAAVVRYAVAHDVAWWVLRALPHEGVAADTRSALADAVRSVALPALAGAREVAELCRVLGDAGVRAVAYKGPALSSDVHGDPGARRFVDLDLLIGETDRARATAALRAAGFVPAAGYTPREEHFYSRWEGVAHFTRGDDWPVELHWRCQAPRYGGPQDPAEVVAAARACALGGGTVLVPAPEDLAVLLALHGAKHAWGQLLWVVDFSAAVSGAAFRWPECEARAASWGVHRAVRYAVLVARDLLGCDVPDALLAAARTDAGVARLAGAVVSRLTLAPDVPDVGKESTTRYDLQWLDGVRAKARYLALAAVLPTPQERRVVRLPDALLPLAYPLRAWRLLQRAFGRRA